MSPAILHCDMNNYYASVEALLNPALRGKALAVCGDLRERHGICLAKSQEAKAAGVKTGDPLFEVRRKCPGVLIIPPHFDAYVQYSRLARTIYGRFTDRVEPFGLDECWLDLSGTEGLFGPPEEAARLVKEAIREELGLTISVGLSHTKPLAKLASDLAGIDEVFPLFPGELEALSPTLPAAALLGVGPATRKKLARYGIHSLRDLAQAEPAFLQGLLGKNGLWLSLCARGEDGARVARDGEAPPVKSVGHGTTLTEDVEGREAVHHVLLEMALDVSFRLNRLGLVASGTELTLRDARLAFHTWQGTWTEGTASPTVLAGRAMSLWEENWKGEVPIRALTLRAVGLRPRPLAEQPDLLGEYLARQRKEDLGRTLTSLRERYGRGAVTYGALLAEGRIPRGRSLEITMPGPMSR